MRLHSAREAGTTHEGHDYQWKAGEVIEVPKELGDILVAQADGGFTPEADLPEPDANGDAPEGELTEAPKRRGRQAKTEDSEPDANGDA